MVLQVFFVEQTSIQNFLGSKINIDVQNLVLRKIIKEVKVTAFQKVKAFKGVFNFIQNVPDIAFVQVKV